MDIDEYQRKASETDQFRGATTKGVYIPLFGLIGEIGSLITSFKKRLRDKASYEDFVPQLREEMGDVLWYLANLATKFNLSLNDVATFNLDKTRSHWPEGGLTGKEYKLYDERAPLGEQLPRQFAMKFTEDSVGPMGRVKVFVEGEQVGNELTDNAYDDDGYRYHDVFHLAYASILGWSPVLRKALGCKRKSNPITDMVEDGARAAFTEELIALYVDSYARRHSYLQDVTELDFELVRTIRNLVASYEVANRTSHEWKTAIIKGYEIYRLLRDNRGGVVNVDLIARNMTYQGS